jgi:hypothetical protein
MLCCVWWDWALLLALMLPVTAVTAGVLQQEQTYT